MIHPQGQPPSRAGRGRASYSPASPMEIGCRAAKRSPRLDMPAGTLGVPMLTAVKIAPAVVHNTRTPYMPSDDHRHGDCRRGGGSDYQAEHPLAGNPDVATDRSRAQTLRPRPPRAMPPGRLRSPPAAPGPRSRASVPDALPAAARRAGRRSWRRTRSGPCPRRRRPAAGRRPDPCRARWRHSSPRPPPPQRAD